MNVNIKNKFNNKNFLTGMIINNIKKGGLSLGSEDPSQIKANLTGQAGKGESSVFNILKNKGFTLVELLVTITMFVIITGVVLVNSNKFDSTILLHNFAYDVALTIKQAQSYGVNVRESSSGFFTSAYGVYFDLAEVGGNTNFVLFNDFNNSSSTNSVTTCTAESECIQKYTMTKGTIIQSICAGADEIRCSDAKRISILFQRPSLEAKIYAYDINDSQILLSGSLPSYAKIVLASTNGATSSVIVTSVGQIYIKK